jgi:hypothetical protein
VEAKGEGWKCFNRENFKGIKTLEECNEKVREDCKFNDRLTWDSEDKACACSKDKDGCADNNLRKKGKSSSVYTTCHRDGVSHLQKGDSIASLTPSMAHDCSKHDRKDCKADSDCKWKGKKNGCKELEPAII